MMDEWAMIRDEIGGKEDDGMTDMELEMVVIFLCIMYLMERK